MWEPHLHDAVLLTAPKAVLSHTFCPPAQLNVPHCIFLVCQECGWKRRFTTNRVGTHRDQLFLPFLGLLPGYALFSPQLREQFKMSSTIPRHGYSSHWCARLDFPLSTSSAGCGCFSPAWDHIGLWEQDGFLFFLCSDYTPRVSLNSAVNPLSCMSRARVFS